MITAILIEQDAHVRGQVEAREKILVEPPAADHVDRMLTDARRSHRKEPQSGRILQFFALQKCALTARQQTRFSKAVSG